MLFVLSSITLYKLKKVICYEQYRIYLTKT